ncbi:hypothetical protein ACE0DR_08845 [Azotobacter sp. CWF10]
MFGCDLQAAACGLPLFQLQALQGRTAEREVQALPGKVLDALGVKKLLPAMIAVGQGGDQEGAGQCDPSGAAPFRMTSRHP